MTIDARRLLAPVESHKLDDAGSIPALATITRPGDAAKLPS